MTKTILALFCSLFLAASVHAGESCQATFDVVKPRVPDKLCRVTLNQQELGGEVDRRVQNLIYQNYMAVDLDGMVKYLEFPQEAALDLTGKQRRRSAPTCRRQIRE